MQNNMKKFKNLLLVLLVFILSACSNLSKQNVNDGPPQLPEINFGSDLTGFTTLKDQADKFMILDNSNFECDFNQSQPSVFATIPVHKTVTVTEFIRSINPSKKSPFVMLRFDALTQNYIEYGGDALSSQLSTIKNIDSNKFSQTIIPANSVILLVSPNKFTYCDFGDITDFTHLPFKSGYIMASVPDGFFDSDVIEVYNALDSSEITMTEENPLEAGMYWLKIDIQDDRNFGDPIVEEPVDPVDPNGDSTTQDDDSEPGDNANVDGGETDDDGANADAGSEQESDEDDNEFVDFDVDGDGVLDENDAFPFDPAESSDFDSDGLGDNADTDDDNDGVLDVDDNCSKGDLGVATDVNPDTDGDGCKNSEDNDDDNDGVGDEADAFPLDNSETTDADSDGVGDTSDACPEVSGGPNSINGCPDTDADGVIDDNDNCPDVLNGEQLDHDLDGIGNVCDLDSDNDGVPNDRDNCSLGLGEISDADGDGCDAEDEDDDDDNDNVPDVEDNCHVVENEDQADVDGDGTGDACDDFNDQDEDGVADDVDAFPNDPNETTDLDNDGVGDNGDNCREFANPQQLNHDGDENGDECDDDDDNDGVEDVNDNCPTGELGVAHGDNPDTDGDGCKNSEDDDDDNDTVFDADDNCPITPAGENGIEGCPDTDADGVIDDEDAFPNDSNESLDSDRDGVGDNADNCPVVTNVDQANNDDDENGDACDDDDDNDGVLDVDDNCRVNVNVNQADFDGDGIGDVCDDDIDGDGVLDLSAETGQVVDQCPLTRAPFEMIVNEQGCLDDDDDGVMAYDIPLESFVNADGFALDNCPFAANSNQQKTDPSKVLGDACQELIIVSDTDNSLRLTSPDSIPLAGSTITFIDHEGNSQTIDTFARPLDLEINVKANTDVIFEGDFSRIDFEEAAGSEPEFKVTQFGEAGFLFSSIPFLITNDDGSFTHAYKSFRGDGAFPSLAGLLIQTNDFDARSFVNGNFDTFRASNGSINKMDLRFWNFDRLNSLEQAFADSTFTEIWFGNQIFDNVLLSPRNFSFKGVFENSRIDYLDMEHVLFENVGSTERMFANAQIDNFKFPEKSTFSGSDSAVKMFRLFNHNNCDEPMDLKLNIDLSQVIRTDDMFRNACLGSIDMGVNSAMGDEMRSSRYMFAQLTTLNFLDLSEFGKGPLKGNINGMFSNSTFNFDLDLSDIDFSEVLMTSAMFSRFTGVSVSFNNSDDLVDFSSLTSMSHMFQEAIVDDLNLKKFQFNALRSMFSMFRNSNLNEVDLSSWNDFGDSNLVSIQNFAQDASIASLVLPDLPELETELRTSETFSGFEGHVQFSDGFFGRILNLIRFFENSNIPNLDFGNQDRKAFNRATLMFNNADLFTRVDIDGVTKYALDISFIDFDRTVLDRTTFGFNLIAEQEHYHVNLGEINNERFGIYPVELNLYCSGAQAQALRCQSEDVYNSLFNNDALNPNGDAEPLADNPLTNLENWTFHDIGRFPCGNGRAAMLWKDFENGYWGCNTLNNIPRGLYVTSDAGENWVLQQRINISSVRDIFLDSDQESDESDRLLLAIDNGSNANHNPISSVVLNQDPLRAERLFETGLARTNKVRFGESVVATSDGQILLDSTETSVAYFPGENVEGDQWMRDVCTGDDTRLYNPSGDFCEVKSVLANVSLDSPLESLGGVRAYDNRFYAFENTRNTPAIVFLPTLSEGNYPFQMDKIILQEEGVSTLERDFLVTDDGLLMLIGQQIDSNNPFIARCNLGEDDNCYSADHWEILDLDIFDSEPWSNPAYVAKDAFAIDAHDETIAIVGSFYTENINRNRNIGDGWVIISQDGGETWQDLTETLISLNDGLENLNHFYNVEVFETGEILLVGDGSYVYNPN